MRPDEHLMMRQLEVCAMTIPVGQHHPLQTAFVALGGMAAWISGFSTCIYACVNPMPSVEHAGTKRQPPTQLERHKPFGNVQFS
mmetsp:Transcript_40356/g.63016  ORF Transcript_40356/g.63016 Transcript_40356/m.63016 type:complete len:84 (-) Transcript_40356:520-771(-)